MRVLTARWLLPVTAPPVRDGAVAVDDTGRIAYAGPASGAPPGEVVALGDAVLLPGLVAARPPYELPVAWIASLPAAGVTTFVTTLSSDNLDRVWLDLLLSRGVRGTVLYAPRKLPRDFPDLAPTILRSAITHAVRPLLHDAGAADRLRVGLLVPPIHEIGEDLLLDVCAWAVGEHVPIALTAGASADEIAFLRDATGPHADAVRAAGHDVHRRAHSTVHLLAELGVAPVAQPLLIGGAHFDASDVALAAYYDTPVAYAPEEALPNATTLRALLDANVRVALAAHTPLATAAALTRTPDEALHLLTLGGARALATHTGSLTPGTPADLCAFPFTRTDLHTADALGPAHALFAAPDRHASLTMIAGHPHRAVPA